MPNITVNPTRMELTRLKGKLRTAQRGHKLLKDKRDELMKQFLDTVREVRALRQEVEEELMTVHGAFTEKTRRRVNALEYVVIPNTQDAIRYITMKLDENDRATTTRLMKVKDMLLQQSIEEQRQRDAEVLERFREA